MKICFVATGDITRLPMLKRATGMATPLIKAGHQVAIVAMDCEGNRERFRLECPDAIPLFFKSGSVWNEVRQKKKLIKSWNPDVVYVCFLGYRNWIHKFNVSTKSVFVVEHSELNSSILQTGHKSIFRFAKHQYTYRIIEYLTIFLFDGLVCASRYLENEYKSMMKKIFRSKNIFYSPYAYNHEILNIESSLYEQLKEKYKGKTVFLFMGTFINLRFLTMIQAAEQLRENCNEFVLLFLGRKSKTNSENYKYIDEHGLNEVIQFTGYIPEHELSSYFKLADAFIAPLHDTIHDKARCPSKMFMYLPFKKPILTCKVGEAYELFGEDGYYFEPADPKSMKSLMKKIVENKGITHRVDTEQHTWDARANDFINWIKQKYNIHK